MHSSKSKTILIKYFLLLGVVFAFLKNNAINYAFNELNYYGNDLGAYNFRLKKCSVITSILCKNLQLKIIVLLSMAIKIGLYTSINEEKGALIEKILKIIKEIHKSVSKADIEEMLDKLIKAGKMIPIQKDKHSNDIGCWRSVEQFSLKLLNCIKIC